MRALFEKAFLFSERNSTNNDSQHVRCARTQSDKKLLLNTLAENQYYRRRDTQHDVHPIKENLGPATHFTFSHRH
jgi:hypothetical protein